MGHTDVVPVNESRLVARPVRRRDGRDRDGVDEVWGRGAVDMLNLTASMAVAFRHLAPHRVPAEGRPDLLRRRRRGERQRPRRAVDGRPRARRDLGRLRAHRERRPALRRRRGAVRLGQRRREGRRLAPAAAARHAGPRLGAVPRRQRAREGRGRRPAARRLRPGAAVPRAVDRAGAHARASTRRPQRMLLDPAHDRRPASPRSRARGIAAYLHACTHTTFSSNVVGGRFKTNVIPDEVELGVDVRTLPGETPDDVAGPPARRARRPRRRGRGRADHERHGHDQPDGDPAVGRARPGDRPAVPDVAADAGARGRLHRLADLPGDGLGRPTAPGCSARASTAASTAAASTATTSGSTSSRWRSPRSCGSTSSKRALAGM